MGCMPNAPRNAAGSSLPDSPRVASCTSPVRGARLHRVAAVVVALVAARAFAVDAAATAPPRSAHELIRSESERTGVSLDANTLFGKLVDRYRGLSFYKDSVKLAHRTVVPQAPAATAPAVEQSIDCTIRGTLLDVVSSAIGAGASCDARDVSPVGKLALAQQMWLLPHMALRFADEPLRSMHGGDCGALVPTSVEEVTIGERPLLRLHLQSGGAAPDPATTCEPTSLDFYVNPQSMLIERIEHTHELGKGVRYEATLEITPSRAVGEPTPPTLDPGDAAPASGPATGPSEAPASKNEPAPKQPAPTTEPASTAPRPGGPQLG